MTQDLVLIEKIGSVACLTLNRPLQRNALNQALVVALENALRELETTGWCRAVMLTGRGSVFCAGGDLSDNVDDEPDAAAAAARHRVFVSAAERLTYLSKPTVAAVNGHAIGAGASLALACDEIVFAPEAKFGLIFLRVGLPPDTLSVQNLRRRVGWTVGTDLLYSARMIAAEEALELGIAHEVADNPVQAALSRACQRAELSPFAFAATKALLREESVPGSTRGELEALMVGVAATTEEFRSATAQFRAPRRTAEGARPGFSEEARRGLPHSDSRV